QVTCQSSRSKGLNRAELLPDDTKIGLQFNRVREECACNKYSSIPSSRTAEGVLAHMPLKKHAILVLPPAAHEGESLPVPVRQQRWLARSRLSSVPGEVLSRILSTLAVPTPPAGLGALRLWGQTGAPPEGWVAAADPV